MVEIQVQERFVQHKKIFTARNTAYVSYLSLILSLYVLNLSDSFRYFCLYTKDRFYNDNIFGVINKVIYKCQQTLKVVSVA